MKIAIINRGISGSGKSTFISHLKETVSKYMLSIAIHSCDDLFMIDGEYHFNVNELEYYHSLTFANYENSLKEGTSIVVCDNTNTAQCEYERYVKSAQTMEYKTISVVFFPSTIEKHFERNRHGVPKDVLIQQKNTMLNNIKTELVDQEYQIKPESFFDDIVKISQTILRQTMNI